MSVVKSISPGFVDTEIFDAANLLNAKMKSSDILSAEEMADMIAFVMSTGPNVLVIITNSYETDMITVNKKLCYFVYTHGHICMLNYFCSVISINRCAL